MKRKKKTSPWAPVARLQTSERKSLNLIEPRKPKEEPATWAKGGQAGEAIDVGRSGAVLAERRVDRETVLGFAS